MATDRQQEIETVSETQRAHASGSESRRWDRAAAILISSLLTFRVVYAALVPLDLVFDEAYYWDWSRHLDWGYYSKPPMVAWLIALSTSVFGSHTLTVRLPAIVLSTLGLGFMYLLGRRLYSCRVGFFACLLSALTPGNAALSLIMTIDAPLLFFWGASLLFLWKCLEGDHHPTCWWLALILTTGLGLLSKQTMFAVMLGAVLFALLSRPDRRQLLQLRFWSWMGASLLFLTPVVVWNVQNDWVTANHTSEHFSVHQIPLTRHLAQSAEFLLGQLGVLSPVFAVVVVTVLSVALWNVRRLPRRELFLCCFSLFPLLAVVGLSLLRRVQPNWPAPFYVTGILLTVAWMCREVRLPVPFHPEQAWRRSASVGAVLTAAVYLVALLPTSWGLAGSRFDPLVRLRNWRELGAAVGAELEQYPRPERTVPLVVTGRRLTSELAFYLPEQPTVYYWNDSGWILSQYDLWPSVESRAGWDVAIITRPDEPLPPRLEVQLSNVRRREQVRIRIGHDRYHDYQMWQATLTPQVAQESAPRY